MITFLRNGATFANALSSTRYVKYRFFSHCGPCPFVVSGSNLRWNSLRFGPHLASVNPIAAVH